MRVEYFNPISSNLIFKFAHLRYICFAMKIVNTLKNWLLNRYILCILVFGVWLTFFDENNLIHQVKSRYELNKLRAEKKYYSDKIADYEFQLKAIDSNPAFIEQFAREHYYMSKDNEDVFVVVADTANNKQ